jgi:thymidylate kinase
VTFWNEIAVFSLWREVMSHRVFKGDRGVGSPDKPLHRRDKNVRSWPVTAMRLVFYLADAIHLRLRVREARRSDDDVVIFDRYIYDELANLPLQRRLTRVYVWFALKVTATPNMAFLIDADPVEALARKPEYPLEFLLRNREAYLTLSKLAREIDVIEPGSVTAMETRITQKLTARLLPQETGASAPPALR